ncbi:MAG TPA: GlcNAc-transferase family protein [Allosphingosinicella sp.]
MLLDSHHRFIPSWDRHLVSMYEGLKAEGVRKPFITAYLPPYEPGGDPDRRSVEPLEIQPRSRERGLLVYLVARPIPLWKSLTRPIPAKYASLHFVFTGGSFNQELAHDEDVYFFGDEVVLALRAYTHGYDLFHPHFVPGWHLYDRTATRTPHWEDHSDYQERNERSCERIRDIFLGIDDKAIGRCRTLEDYEWMINDRLIRC